MSRIEIIQDDITSLDVDCIVNAANASLLGGSGVDGAIHAQAGPQLLEECKSLNGCETGQAKITKGYNLPAKYIIHTVGPIYSKTSQDAIDLENCYINSLNLAKEHNLHSIAFPGISTGVYGYPLKQATIVAYTAVSKWLNENTDYDMTVIFCTYSENAYQTYLEYDMRYNTCKTNH